MSKSVIYSAFYFWPHIYTCILCFSESSSVTYEIPQPNTDDEDEETPRAEGATASLNTPMSDGKEMRFLLVHGGMDTEGEIFDDALVLLTEQPNWYRIMIFFQFHWTFIHISTYRNNISCQILWYIILQHKWTNLIVDTVTKYIFCVRWFNLE